MCEERCVPFSGSLCTAVGLRNLESRYFHLIFIHQRICCFHWLLKEIEQGHQLDFSLLSQTAHCPKYDLSASITKRIQLRTSPNLPCLDSEGDFRASLPSRCCAWLLTPISFPEEPSKWSGTLALKLLFCAELASIPSENSQGK